MSDELKIPTPSWVNDFREKFSGGLSHTFILQGAVEDYVGAERTRLDHYLSELLGSKRVVVFFNCSRGISFAAPSHRSQFDKNEAPAMHEAFLPEPLKALPLIEKALLSADLKGKMALIVEYPELVWPQGDYGHLGQADRIALATLRRWAVGSEFIQAGQVILLVTPTAGDLHASLRATSSMIEAVEIPYPTTSERQEFIEGRLASGSFQLSPDLTATSFANLTGGLSRVLVDDICLRAALRNEPVNQELIRDRKEQIIKQEFGEVIEILEPRHGFDQVGGLDEVKQYLQRSVIDPLQGRASKDRMPSGVMLAGPPGTGKGQPLDAKVLTPTGWITMNEIEVGTALVDPSTGGQTRVTGVYPQGQQDVYRMMFSDGSSTECDGSHLWSIRKHGIHKDFRTVPAGELYEWLRENPGRRAYIPTTAPIDMAGLAELPLSPYVLGALLGDGGLTGSYPVLSSADSELLERVLSELPQGVCLRRIKNSQYDHRVVKKKRNSRIKNPVQDALDRLGLLGCRSHEKFIPEVYKFAPRLARLEVLRGLLDTDGSVSKIGCVEFCTCSETMADDLVFLVRSLGGRAEAKRSKSYRSLGNGERIQGKDRFRVVVSMPTDYDPFHLSRKKERLLRERRVYDRRIVSMEKIGRKPTQCIKVDSESELYITDDMIVTHNTFLVSALAHEAGVNVVKLNAGRLLGQYVGNSERNLEKALACIRSLAPTLVMIDEIEQQFQRGGKGDGGVERRIFGRILEEMSGSSSTARGDVVWFAATNRVELVDPALRRPGRFDRIVPILPPTAEERWAILHTKLPQGTQISQEEGAQILGATADYTGAEIEGVMIKAKELALDRGVESVDGIDIIGALQVMRPSSNGQQIIEMTEEALRYCNDLSLVPPSWRERVKELENS